MGVVAYSGKIPHVVHGPDDGFVERSKFPDAIERHQSLIDPSKHHDIGLTHKRMLVNGHANVGYRDTEKIGSVYTV